MKEIRGFIAGIGLMSIPLAYDADFPGAINWAAVAGIGTLLAVFVAVIIPMFQRSAVRADAERARKLKARALAHHTYPALLELRANLGHVILVLSEYSPHPSPGRNLVLSDINLPDLPEFRLVIENIEVFPQGLAATWMQMLSLITRHNRLLDKIAAHEGMKIDKDLLLAIPGSLIKLLGAVIDEVRLIHDAKALE